MKQKKMWWTVVESRIQFFSNFHIVRQQALETQAQLIGVVTM